MAWQQLQLQLPAPQLPQAEALLELLGARSVTLLGAGAAEILEPDPGTTPLWPVTRVRALFPDGIDLQRVSQVLEDNLHTDLSVITEPLEDSAWIGSLSAEPREQIFERRLAITSAQSVEQRDDRTTVRLNRGLGFGTGQHATTRLCLQWLDSELEPGATVLDYGCGSGVLALAALKLGASRAWAVDIEPQALEATGANAALNGIGKDLWIGSPDDLAQIEAEVVLCNILARPLIELAPRLAALTGQAGTAVLSGVLESQLDETCAAYANFFDALDTCVLEGWGRIVARRSGS